jgi:uncharacterized protein
MTHSANGLNRRDFLKVVGAAGLCPLLASAASGATGGLPASANANDTRPGATGGLPASANTNDTRPAAPPAGGQVPKRKLGKTGVMIPVVGVGSGIVNLDNSQDVLARALELGMTYWDASISYGGAEQGIAKYLAQNPGLRQKMFLVTKSADIGTPMPVIADIEKQFQQSLKRLQVEHIDLYCGVHAMPDAKMLTDDLRAWAEEKKKKGLIRFFGFSTHSNMGRNLLAASKLDWIDACLARSDFRVLREPEMAAGVEAIAKAGIGLISIKAMSVGLNPNAAEDKKLSGGFLDKGFDAYQAKLKALLEDQRFASAAVGMKTVAQVDSCAAAAMDKTRLTDAHWQALDQYAQATCSNFCAGCSHICAQAIPDVGNVSDVMRYLMYHNSYGQHAQARALFARIPQDALLRMRAADYSLAEARCPQHIPVGAMVAEAFRVLA